MKKTILSFAVFTLFFFASYSGTSADKNRIGLVIDNQDYGARISLMSINNITFGPLEDLCLLLNCSYNQINPYTFIITSPKTGYKLQLQTGNKTAKLNGSDREAPAAPITIGNTAMVPVSFFITEIGGSTSWDPASNSVIITSYTTVQFKDTDLENLVRKLLSKPSGDILECDVEDISLLNVPSLHIKNLAGLEHFKSLTYLNISGNSISDLSPLGNLTKLSELYIEKNPVWESYTQGKAILDYAPIIDIYVKLSKKDFTLPVQFLDKNLENVIRKKIQKLFGEIILDDLVNITELDASGQGITDLTGIQNLLNLTQLNLSNNNIRGLEPLSKLSKLKTLILHSNTIDNISSLCDLTSLETLDLYNNKIVNLSSIDKLVRLKRLSLWKNKISSITNFKYMPGLEVLVLSDNNVSSIAPLMNLNNLKELYIGGNPIENFEPVRKLCNKIHEDKRDFKFIITFTDTKLENEVRKALKKYSGPISMEDAIKVKRLSLPNKGISNLEGLQYFSYLEILDLSNNKISDISRLNKLHNMQVLDLSSNNISNISALNNLNYVKILYLRNNKINNISVLKNLPYLRSLYLSQNPISDYYPVANYYEALESKDFSLDYIKVTLNFKNIVFDTPPINDSNIIMVQLTPLLNEFGINYKYNSKSRVFYAANGNSIIILSPGSKYMILNGENKKMDIEAKICNDKLYVPLEFLAQCLGVSYEWDSQKNTARLTKRN